MILAPTVTRVTRLKTDATSVPVDAGRCLMGVHACCVFLADVGGKLCDAGTVDCYGAVCAGGDDCVSNFLVERPVSSSQDVW